MPSEAELLSAIVGLTPAALIDKSWTSCQVVGEATDELGYAVTGHSIFVDEIGNGLGRAPLTWIHRCESLSSQLSRRVRNTSFSTFLE